jgi:L-alanine-DL-glutamate epimerase-like enolase superfamily enzyme
MAVLDRIEVTVAGPDIVRTTWASMPPQFMALTVARIWDEDGNEGVGATQTYAAGSFDTSAFEGSRALAAALVGKEADNREERWRDLQTNVVAGPAGSVAVLDNALWDLAARKAGLPLYRFLGGSRDQIPAYASTAELPETKDYLKLVEELGQQGYRAIKFHAWNQPDRDLEMLRAVYKEFGDSGLVFMHDAENRYDRQSAVRVAMALDQMGFRWFEAPLVDYDVDGYREIRRHVSIPLVPHGLWIDDLRELLVYLRQGVWDAVRFDACSAGGITLCRKLCALAEAFGLPAEPQSWGYSLIQSSNLHLGLSVANASYFELPVPYEAYEYAVSNPIRVNDQGTVTPPAEPGLGLIIDWDRINRDRLSSFEFRRTSQASHE